jgi:hypothetical protein
MAYQPGAFYQLKQALFLANTDGATQDIEQILTDHLASKKANLD